MRRLDILHNGQNLLQVTRAEAEARLGQDGLSLWDAAAKIADGLLARNAVRATIAAQVGDRDSILGTTADATQINAAILLAFLSAMADNTTISAIRTQFLASVDDMFPTPDGETGLTSLAKGFVTAIEAGDIQLTANVKTPGTVLDEIATRSTGVATILAAIGAQGVDG
ncbi:hypothetical protein ACFFUB_00505 [Algimonas porphyrae]|uniref:Uncharacterized protein n=1 Tax=Algimonas porphyrae TaxID=1128113 RepID=A0ABQ5V1Q7_9PROT|nr:hypothetical protein [Algimonas porphyrae]GLQ20511.1 hypothetical protein GCM10007854_14660 [Algimonas porphyrae]